MVKIKEYFEAFASLEGAGTALVTSVPLWSKLWGENVGASLLFPPVGDAVRYPAFVVALTVAFAVLAAQYLRIVQSSKGRLRLMLGLVVLGLVGVCCFVIVRSLYVLDLPFNGDKTVSLLIGWELTPFARDTLLPELKRDPQFQSRNPSSSDLLRHRGLTDEVVTEIWTPASIIKTKLLVTGAYLLILLPFVASLSFLVLYEKLGPPALQ